VGSPANWSTARIWALEAGGPDEPGVIWSDALPPVEHRLGALQRRRRAVGRHGRGRMKIILQRQEIEIKVGKVTVERSGAGP
jgi:hypothetical protein